MVIQLAIQKTIEFIDYCNKFNILEIDNGLEHSLVSKYSNVNFAYTLIKPPVFYLNKS